MEWNKQGATGEQPAGGFERRMGCGRGGAWREDGGGGGEIVGDGETEGLAVEFPGGDDVQCLRGGIGVDAFGIGGGCLHPIAALALGGGWHIAVETRDARDDDLSAVGLVDDLADAAVDGDDDGVVK